MNNSTRTAEIALTGPGPDLLVLIDYTFEPHTPATADEPAEPPLFSVEDVYLSGPNNYFLSLNHLLNLRAGQWDVFEDFCYHQLLEKGVLE